MRLSLNILIIAVCIFVGAPIACASTNEESAITDDAAPTDDSMCTCTIVHIMTKDERGSVSNYVCEQKSGIRIRLTDSNEDVFTNGDNFIAEDHVSETVSFKCSDLVGGPYDSSVDLSKVNYRLSSKSFRQETRTMGEFTAIVVTVGGTDGAKPVDDAQSYSKEVFTNDSNMVRQFSDCSGGRTIISPGTGPGLKNGAIDLTINAPIAGVNIVTAENMVMDALANLGILPNNSDREGNKYDFFIIIMPTEDGTCVVRDDGSCFGGAWASMPGFMSTYSEGAGRQTMYLQHEVGHNFGQNHSTKRKNEYGDGTCVMGGNTNCADQNVCFNGAKSWHLGYYADRHIQIVPTTSNADVLMVSLNDYNNGEVTDEGQYTVAKISGDTAKSLYILYNRAEEFMKDTEEPDEIVIVEQKDSNKGPLNSKLMGHIDVGEEYTQSNWNGGDKSLIIKVCSKVVNGSPDYARIQVYLQGSELDCNTAPIDVPPTPPTSAPNTAPIDVPPTPPTPAPNTVPTNIPPTSAPTPALLLNYIEIDSETCEHHGLETITVKDECKTAAESVGITRYSGPAGPYSDNVDGCSVRYRSLRRPDLYINGIGNCDLDSSGSYFRGCKCHEDQICLCRNANGPTSSPNDSTTNSPTSSPTSSPIGSPTGSPTSSPTGSPTSSPIGSPTGSPTSSPNGSTTGNPTRLTSDPTYVRFQSRSNLKKCLGINGENLKSRKCDAINDGLFWFIDNNGFLVNKTGKVVKRNYKLVDKPDKLFDGKYVFVYNIFHETLIYAKTLKAMYLEDDGSISFEKYLKDGDVHAEMKWIVLE